LKTVSLPVLRNEQLPQQDADWVRDSEFAEHEREKRPSGPAVCLRAVSHVERPNGLIGVSGNGRYLTRPINKSGLKRLEAWLLKEMHVCGVGVCGAL